MSLKYGIIGCGRISPNHIAAAQHNNLDIVAICDLVESEMDDSIKNFDLSQTVNKYTNYKEMIKK